MHFIIDFNIEMWNEHAEEKVLWLENIKCMDHLDAKQKAVVYTMKLQKNKELLAVSLCGTLHIKWWNDNLLEMLVML